VVLYEIYREDGGNGITFVHMLYVKCSFNMGNIIFVKNISHAISKAKNATKVILPILKMYT
jgi:hypothetical protein